MKNFRLKDIQLISHRERRARKVKFDPQITVIKGQNDTGKSSLIKSIYHTFGATPHSIHHKWKAADVASLISFTVDEVDFSIFRHRDSFSIFDENDNLVATCTSITNELGPELSKIFGFNLKISNRQGKSVTPPPAYLFLPFYVDQDNGWVTTWGSFENLQQFSNWKKTVINYHMGIRPDKWYILDAQKKQELSRKDEPERQLESYREIRKKMASKMARVDFEIDIDSFTKEIELLLKECENLRGIEAKYKATLVDLRISKIRLEAQVEIVTRTHDEISADYKFADDCPDDSVDCPTCGAQYNNSFRERFEIAKDTETCVDLLESVRGDLRQIESEITNTEVIVEELKNKQNSIRKILARKQGEIKLSDVVDLRSRQALFSQLDPEIEALNTTIDNIVKRVGEYEEGMAKLKKPKREKKIKTEYKKSLRRNVAQLEVHGLDEKVYKNPASAIEESGSDLPRAILAYFFTILEAIQENGSASFCPIVIDAPNQQEQDDINLDLILNFVSKNRPPGKQMILGLVDDLSIEFGGTLISLTTKYSLLQEDEYDDVAQSMKYYERLNLGIP